MPISRIELNEYTCVLCDYKWISRVNGKDGPIPKRCAKCKRQHWNKGEIDGLEKSYRDALKRRFGYWNSASGIYQGGWRVEENIIRYLQPRPSVNEMRVLLHPMSYLHEYRPSYNKTSVGCVPASDRKHIDMKATKKAHEYERELSRQLLKDLMTERGIPYDENEVKKVSLYRQHGTYATLMFREVPKLCNALKQDQPEWSNEDIKTRVLEDYSKELKYVVASPQELIQSCWPDWIK